MVIPVATFLLFLSCGSGIQLWVGSEWMIPVVSPLPLVWQWDSVMGWQVSG